MEYYSLTFDKVILRFYLMMALVIVPFFIGYPILAVLSVPVFLSTMLGVSFKKKAVVLPTKAKSISREMFTQRTAA